MTVQRPPKSAAHDASKPSDVGTELRRISMLFGEIARSFERLAEALGVDAATEEDEAKGGVADDQSPQEAQKSSTGDVPDDRDWETITREAIELLKQTPHVEWDAGKLAAELHVRGVLTGPRRGVHWTLMRKLGDRVEYEG